jgi:uncharacterized delta-60 repeat protein
MPSWRHGALCLLLPVIGAVFAPVPATAAERAGGLDLAFGSCGSSIVPARDYKYDGGWATTGDAVAVQPDGRVLLASRMGLTRLLADGSLDHSFGVNGSALRPFGMFTLHPQAVAVQADGRILVAATEPDSPAFVFSRYLPSGAVDTTFGVDGDARVTTGGWVSSIVLQPDGKILAGGQPIVRLLANGALDPTFGVGGVVPTGSYPAVSLALQTDGRIVTGVGVSGGRNGDFGVMRRLSDGTPDPTFGTAGVATLDSSGHDGTIGAGIDADGRIVSVGQVRLMSQYEPHGIALMRHLPDGTLDTTYGTGGLTIQALADDESVRDMVLQPDGKVVVLSAIDPEVHSEPVAVTRFSAEGKLDTTFGDGGTSVFSQTDVRGEALVRAPDGDLVVAASNGVYDGTVVLRFHGTESALPRPVTAANCSREVSFAPGFGEFGSWAVGTRSTPRILTLRSTGTAPVRVDRVELTRDRQSQYTVTNRCAGMTLAPGASCQIEVSYLPRVVGNPDVPILLIWDSAQSGSQSDALRGVGRPATTPWAWGWNGFGQVGSGTPQGSGSTKLVNLPDTAGVAAGWYHSLAVRADGTVWAWGWNAFGQLGDGSRTSRTGPVRVPGLTNIASVAAGAYQSFAIGRDGSVWAWGLNVVGELGDGTTVDRLLPVRLTSLPPIANVSGGYAHTVATASDGTVWTWGWNMFGQLGDGTTIDRHAPTQVPGLTGIRLVSAGVAHSVAVTAGAGEVSAWGWNVYGQLGDGTTTDRHQPIPVPGLEGVLDIAAGAYHTVAALRYAPPVAWGWNAMGQLGDGTTVDRHAPVPVAMAVPVDAVAASFYNSMALTTGDVYRAWGWDDFGQAGDGGTMTIRLTPTYGNLIPGVGAVAAGVLHSLVA